MQYILVDLNKNPLTICGGEGNTLYNNEILVYDLDKPREMIVKHQVEHLFLNNILVQAPYGIFETIIGAVEADRDPKYIPC